MTRQIPAALTRTVATALIVGGATLGVLADLGVGGAVLGSALVIGAVLGMLFAGNRGLTWLDLATAVLCGSLVLVIAHDRRTADERDAAKAELERLHEEPTTYKFTVIRGEQDPDPSADFDYGEPAIAYQRVEPGSEIVAELPDPEQPGRHYRAMHEIGEKVEVICEVPSNDKLTWYRLDTGAFMHDAVIKQVPFSGRGPLPVCRD